MKEALVLAGLGSWEWEAISDRVTWSDELYRLYGLEPGSAPASFEAFLSWVLPADRERIRKTVEKAAAEGSSFEHEERILDLNGKVRVFHSRGGGPSSTNPEGRSE
jgi:PAS domain-containing protein